MQLPFLVRPDIKTEAVGDPTIGILHFLQLGDIAIAEDPPSLQKRNDMTMGMVLVLEDVAERMSKELGVPLQYCREKTLSVQAADKNSVTQVIVNSVNGQKLDLSCDKPLSKGDWLQFQDEILVIKSVVPRKKGNVLYEIAEPFSNLQAGDTGLVKIVDIDSFLTRNERIDQIKTNLTLPEIPIEAATLLIQNRVLYPVQLAADSAPNAKSISLKPLSVALQSGDSIKFPTKTMNIVGDCPPTPIDIEVQPIAIAATSTTLKKGEIGYILRDGSYLQGAPGWEQSNTEKLGKKMVDAIYAFYQREKAAAPTPEDVEPAEGNDLNKQKSLEPVPQ